MPKHTTKKRKTKIRPVKKDGMRQIKKMPKRPKTRSI